MPAITSGGGKSPSVLILVPPCVPSFSVPASGWGKSPRVLILVPPCIPSPSPPPHRPREEGLDLSVVPELEAADNGKTVINLFLIVHAIGKAV